MKTNNKLATIDIVHIALFAALTVIGTSIRIPMPASIGNPFVHLGNSVVLLGILLLGFKKGALAGGIGFFIFDVLNGYAIEAPYFLFESFVIAAVATYIWGLFNYADRPFYKLLIVIISACGAKLILSYFKNLVMALFVGTSLTVAATTALNSLFATFVNVITTTIIVSLAYYPLKQISHLSKQTHLNT